MQAQTHTPAGIFGNQIRYVIPLFQRPYVWTRDEQWEPLWLDVRNLAERLLDAPPPTYGSPPVPPHFLGAIVVDQQLIPTGYITVRHVVDGQQRLTTLQLLLDASEWVVQKHGAAIDTQALRGLVCNDHAITANPDEVFKVWPTDRDQAAFRAAMSDDVEVGPLFEASRIAQAHRYFVEQVSEWALEEGGDPVRRLNALVRALRDHLRLVVIDLEPGDNAQVIFETLNHRGSPLLAADLVKNLVFQLAHAQGADVQALYARYWKDLDSDFWRALVSQGRRYRPRIDIFLNYWLTMKLGREVPNDQVFAVFRDNVVAATPIAELLGELAVDAAVYAGLDKLPAESAAGDFYYRVVKAMDTAATMPVLMWVLRWPAQDMPADQQTRCLRSLESWIIRRALVRATAKGVNQVAVEILKVMADSGPAGAGDATEAFLARQTADARYWPDDAALHARLDTHPLYTALTRPRLRMLLEALEDSLRSGYGEGQPCPRGLTVEHVMPQGWREHWGADVADDPAAQTQRDVLVQSLGNLTLVTGKFNTVLSNRPWTDEEATARGLKTGKRAYLHEHSQLSLNSRLVGVHEAAWTEADIRARSADLTQRIAALWTRPPGAAIPGQQPSLTEPAPGAEPEDDDTAAEPGGATASHSGKYRNLWAWLSAQDRAEIRLSFADVEQILGFPLPPSSRTHLPHWYGYDGTAVGRAIRDAGWKASQVNIVEERLLLLPAET